MISYRIPYYSFYFVTLCKLLLIVAYLYDYLAHLTDENLLDFMPRDWFWHIIVLVHAWNNFQADFIMGMDDISVFICSNDAKYNPSYMPVNPNKN